MSRMTHVLHVFSQEPSKSSQISDDDEVLDRLLIMLETQNLVHMFGGTCDHKLLCHWAEGPPNMPSAGARMKGAWCPDILVI